MKRQATLFIAALGLVMSVAASNAWWRGVSVPVGTTYYFSPSGNDTSNNCQTLATPCQTLAKAGALNLISNDQVLFQGGQTYNVSSVVAGASGLTILLANVNATAAYPVTLGSYGTGNAIFSDAGNGNTFQIGAGGVKVDHITFTSTTAKQAIQWLNSATNVILDGAFATNLTVNGYTRDALQFVGNAGTSGWNHFQAINNTIDGSSSILQQGIYANTTSAPLHTMANCLIQGNIIHDIYSTPVSPGGASGNGILLTQTSGCDMRSNLTYNIGLNNTTCGGPVGQWAFQSDHITIEYDEAYNIKPMTPAISAASWSATGGGQITFTLATPDPNLIAAGNFSVNGMIPTAYNTGTGGGYTILAGSTSTSLIVAKTSNPGVATTLGIVFPFGCDWDGFDFDDFVSDSVMQYNYAHDNWGIGLLYFFTQGGAPTHGNNIIRFNIAETLAPAVGSAGIVIGTNGTPVLTNPSYVYNNTLYGNDSSYSCFFSDANVSGVTVSNNICQASGGFAFAVNFSAQVSSAMNFIGNDYFVQGSASFVRWGPSGFYSSLSAWQTATGEEQISGVNVGTTANPLLVAPGSGGTCTWTPPSNTGPQPCPANYKLQHGSPMIGTGLTPAQVGVPNFGQYDYYRDPIPHVTGTGWNIGADGAAR